MKKHFQIILICALLLCGATAHAIEYRDEIYNNADPISLYSDMSISTSVWIDDTLYMLGDSLRSYTLGADKMQTLATYAADGLYFDDPYPEEIPTILTTDGKTLFGLSGRTGAFGPVVQGRIQKSIQLQWDEILIDDEPRFIQCAQIVGSVLYCSVQHLDYLDEVEPYHMQMVGFDLLSGESVRTPFDVNAQICAFQDNTLLVFDQDTGLFVYNQETGNMGRQLLTTSADPDGAIPTVGYASNGFYYLEEEDAIYFLEAFYGEQAMMDGTSEFRDEICIRSMPGDGGEPETVCILPVRYGTSVMLTVTATHIISRVWNSVFIVTR